MYKYTSTKIDEKSDYNFCNNIIQIPLTYGEERYKKNTINLKGEIIGTLQQRKGIF